MKTLNFGMIGSGFMGKGFALALKSVSTVFGMPVSIGLEILATSSLERASKDAAIFGFNRASGNWQEVVNDPHVDAVINCTPNHLHKDIVLAAMKAGKHILSEKPLGLNGEEAKDMFLAAEMCDVNTMVGFCYTKNPATQLAREIIQRGEIGDIVHFRGTHVEDYLMDSDKPGDWRIEQSKSGPGALADLCHIVNMAQYLCGDINQVMGDTQIVYPSRPDPAGGLKTVENDDQAHLLCRFSSGALGYLECSRIAAGRKMGLTYEITGTTGSIYFDQSRLSEIQLYSGNDKLGREGFRTILLGPEHPDYAAFLNAPGHCLGYNDMLTIELRDFIIGILDEQPVWPSFRDGYATARVIDAILLSQKEQRWIEVAEI